MRALLTLLLFGVIAFSGCNGDSPTPNSNQRTNSNLSANSNVNFTPPPPIAPKGPADPNFQSCNTAFPLVPNSQAKYLLQFSSALTAEVNVVVSQGEENGKPVFIETTQIIDRSGGLYKNELTVRKYFCDNGRIQLLSEKTDNKTEKGASTMEMEFDGVAIALPEMASLLRKGTTWNYALRPVGAIQGTQRIEGEKVRVSFEVLGEEKVTVPGGEFTAIKVQRKVKDAVIIDYYVRGIGLVKRTTNEGSYWELKEFSGLRAS